MGSLSHALLSAGIITQNQFTRQTTTEKRQQEKAARRNGERGFTSLRGFLDYARRQLNDHQSPDVVEQLLRDGHAVCNSLHIRDDQRGRMHAFLCAIKEATLTNDPEEWPRFLRTQFRNFEPSQVTRG